MASKTERYLSRQSRRGKCDAPKMTDRQIDELMSGVFDYIKSEAARVMAIQVESSKLSAKEKIMSAAKEAGIAINASQLLRDRIEKIAVDLEALAESRRKQVIACRMFDIY